MRRRIKDKTKIELDLTSLLDVIFIILMIVMCHSMVTASVAESKVEDTTEIEQELSEAQDTIAMYEAREQEILNVEDRVLFLSIYVDFDETDVKTRTIKLMYDESFEIEPIVITSVDEQSQYKLFESKLSEYLSNNADKPVLMTLDEKNILYRDHEKVYEILDDLKEMYPNLFIQ